MRRLPLFVLPTVLFPGALLPLHVFEPRYRQMAARCLETDRRFGVLFHDSETGPFELADDAIGCVAEILEFKPLPDGRSLMATRGTERFRVVDGIESDTLFTEALVEPWPDFESDEVSRLTARRFRTAELFHEAAVHTGRTPDAIPRIDTGRDVSWQVAQAFQIEEPWRQSLLEIRSEIHRLDEIDRVLNTVIDFEG
jgi:Lon protease-like protein